MQAGPAQRSEFSGAAEEGGFLHSGGGLVARDQASLGEGRERRVHGLHALARAELDVAGDLVGHVVADARADGRVGDHDLAGEGAPAALFRGDELLADDGLDTVGELGEDLGAFFWRENRDDAVDGLCGVGGVEGADDEVAGLGGSEAPRDALQVAHFTDEDDVGVLAEDAGEARCEGWGIGPDLALFDDAEAVGVDEFHGVLDGDDDAAAAGIDVLDHGGGGGALAGAGGSGDEHEAIAQATETFGDGRQAEIGERGYAVFDPAKRGLDVPALPVGVAAESSCAGHRERKIELAFLGQAAPLVVRERREKQGGGVADRPAFGQRQQFALDAEERRCARGQVEVGSAAFLG